MKLFKDWEYWQNKYFYIPNVPYALYLAIKAKSLMFFSMVNPSIKFSGAGTESKYTTLGLIPKKFLPTSIFIPANEDHKKVLEKISSHHLSYPLIIKPDIGAKGLLVKQLISESELLGYLNQFKSIDMILQEFIDFKNECAILYHRFPEKDTGNITSLTFKKFLSVIGDGESSINDLIEKDDRARRYKKMIESIHGDKLTEIPGKESEVFLSVVGNHCKGTQFIDGNHLITKELEETIDRFFKQIPDFYYGRLDLKYNTLESLIHQEDFKVIELNGIMCDPVHIYDGIKGSYAKALKSIRQHWKIICNIAIQQRKRGVKSDSTYSFIKSLLEYAAYVKKINRSR